MKPAKGARVYPGYSLTTDKKVGQQTTASLATLVTPSNSCKLRLAHIATHLPSLPLNDYFGSLHSHRVVCVRSATPCLALCRSVTGLINEGKTASQYMGKSTILFFDLKSLLQPKFQHASSARGRSIGNVLDKLLVCGCCQVSGVRKLRSTCSIPIIPCRLNIRTVG